MKDFKIYLSIAVAILLVYIVAQYNKPTPINWNPTFYYNDKIPNGTYIYYHQLNQLFPGSNIIKTSSSIYSTFHDTSFIPGTYLIITRNVNVSKNDFNELVNYVKKGNSVFIACFNFEGFLSDTLKLTTSYENPKGNAILSFTNEKLNQRSGFRFDKNIGNQYFSGFDTAKAVVIGKNSFGDSNYLSFKFGKGNLYLCANPFIFTNIGLLSKRGAEYAATALSYLPVTDNVYWDEFQNGDVPGDDSPMRVFFSHASLQWAWYLSIFSMLIFVLFEIKRRQRIIPVIEPLKNSTLEFVNVVGQVYYEKRNNTNIANKKIIYLLAHLRDEYQIKTNKLDDEFVEKLKSKLGIDAAFAKEFVNYIQQISVKAYVSDRELIELNKLIEKLYTQSA